MAVLKLTQFGNPILRQVAEPIPTSDINGREIQQLIKDMRHLLLDLDLGVGLAAPQAGQGKALVVIEIHPREHRPNVKDFSLVLINPKITETRGRRKQSWEGCISSGKGKAGLFAKVPRYMDITATYHDEKGKKHTRRFRDLKAHVIQHEVDHLNGILFVDRVKDSKTYMTYDEYLKQVKKKRTKVLS